MPPRKQPPQREQEQPTATPPYYADPFAARLQAQRQAEMQADADRQADMQADAIPIEWAAVSTGSLTGTTRTVLAKPVDEHSVRGDINSIAQDIDRAYQRFPDNEQTRAAKLLLFDQLMKRLQSFIDKYGSLLYAPSEAQKDYWTNGHAAVIKASEEYAQQLQKASSYAKDKHSMEIDAQQIIEQAVSAGTIAPDNLAHPEPDTIAELEVTAAEATRLRDTLGELRERGIPLSATEAEFAVAGLYAIAERNQRTARELGLHAAERGIMSQRKLAKLVHVSQVAVHKWLSQGTDEPKEQ